MSIRSSEIRRLRLKLPPANGGGDGAGRGVAALLLMCFIVRLLCAACAHVDAKNMLTPRWLGRQSVEESSKRHRVRRVVLVAMTRRKESKRGARSGYGSRIRTLHHPNYLPHGCREKGHS